MGRVGSDMNIRKILGKFSIYVGWLTLLLCLFTNVVWSAGKPTGEINRMFLDEVRDRLTQKGIALPALDNLRERYDGIWSSGILDDTWDALCYRDYKQLLWELLQKADGDTESAEYLNTMLFLLENRDRLLGKFEIVEGEEVRADDWCHVRATFTEGEIGLKSGDRIVFIFAHTESDWARLQSKNPKDANYFTATAIGGGSVRVAEVWKKSEITQRLREVHIEVEEPAREYSFCFGDRTGGSPGWRTQTFPGNYFISLLISFKGSNVYIPKKVFHITATPQKASAFKVFAPSIIKPGEECSIRVLPISNLGSVAEYDGDLNGYLVKAIPQTDERIDLKFEKGKGYYEGKYKASGEGIHRLRVQSADGKISGLSNPMVVKRDADKRIFWSDLHSHSWLSDGMDTEERVFEYAKSCSALDIVALTDHSDSLTRTEWKLTEQCSEKFNEDGVLVTMLGYEWSNGNPDNKGGHFNIYFPTTTARKMNALEITSILKTMKELDRTGKKYLVIPHAHCPGDWRVKYPETVRVVEIHSVHASFEWFGKYYLSSGNKVGFVGGSDSHSGNPGLSPPTGVRATSGLGAIFSAKLSRESLWQSLWDRSCYATTGERIYLDITADGSSMGSEISTHEIDRLRFTAAGTAPLNLVQLIRNGEVYKSYDLAGAKGNEPTSKYRFCFTSSTLPDGEIASGYFPPTKNWGTVSVSLNGNTFRNVEQFNHTKRMFRVIGQESKSLSFALVTRGDECGFILETEKPDVGQLTVKIDDEVYKIDLTEKKNHTFTSGIGTFWLKRLGGDLETYDFSDEITSVAITEPHEYFYLKATQIDGQMAWSSPIFVKQDGGIKGKAKRR